MTAFRKYLIGNKFFLLDLFLFALFLQFSDFSLSIFAFFNRVFVKILYLKLTIFWVIFFYLFSFYRLRIFILFWYLKSVWFELKLIILWLLLSTCVLFFLIELRIKVYACNIICFLIIVVVINSSTMAFLLRIIWARHYDLKNHLTVLQTPIIYIFSIILTLRFMNIKVFYDLIKHLIEFFS